MNTCVQANKGRRFIEGFVAKPSQEKRTFYTISAVEPTKEELNKIFPPIEPQPTVVITIQRREQV